MNNLSVPKLKLYIKSNYKTYLMLLAMGILCFISAYILFRYLKLGTPFHIHVDEGLVTPFVIKMFNNNTFELNSFKYPGLSYYYGLVLLKVLSPIFTNLDPSYLLRLIYVGTALFSNIFIYFTLNKILKNKFIAGVGCTLSFFSLYIPQWLFYTGPDVLLYAFGNIVLYLFVSLLLSENEEKNIYFYLPILSIIIGFACATKYHGILLYTLVLYAYITKRYYKNYKYNFTLLISTLLIPITFIFSNPYILANFKGFIKDFLWNLNHYSGKHAGLDDPMPLLTYTNVFFTYEFGFFGGVLIITGIIYLIKRRNITLLIGLLLLPAVTIFVLSRYQLSLPRNISYIIPFAFILLMMGIIGIYTSLTRFIHKTIIPKAIITVIFITLIIPYILIFNHISGFKNSRDAAQQYIIDNIPEGSTIYLPLNTNKNGTWYMPGIDHTKYNIVKDRWELNIGDYIVDTSLRWIRYEQTNHSILGGELLYPDILKNIQKQYNDYELLCNFPNFSSSYEKRFTQKEVYDLQILQFNHDEYYYGPIIDIYQSKKDLRFKMSDIILSADKTLINTKKQSSLKIKLNIKNSSKIKLFHKAAYGVHPTQIYYKITDLNGNTISDNKNKLISLERDIEPKKADTIDMEIPLNNLQAKQNYVLHIDIVKEKLYKYSDLGMAVLTIPITITK